MEDAVESTTTNIVNEELFERKYQIDRRRLLEESSNAKHAQIRPTLTAEEAMTTEENRGFI